MSICEMATKNWFLKWIKERKREMGVKLLNRFLKQKCGDAINELHIDQLTGKKIAIDISIFLYKFKYYYQDNHAMFISKFIVSNNTK